MNGFDFCKGAVTILESLVWMLMITSCAREKTNTTMDTPLRNYTVAMIQMKVEAGKPDANLARAEQRVAEAAKQGAKIAVLPEVMDLGWTDPSARELAYGIPDGKTCRRLRDIALKNNMYVCAGLIEKDGDKRYNAAVVINPNGVVILKHRKLNELDIAHDLYDQGDGLNVAHTPLGTIGLYICADATASGNVLSNALGYMGADIILSPSAWAVPPDFDNTETPYGDTWRNVYKPVSAQFGLWVIGVSNVGKIEAGPWKDWDCIGSSLAYNADGQEILQGPFGAQADTILYVDVALKDRPARGTAWQEYWNRKKDLN